MIKAMLIKGGSIVIPKKIHQKYSETYGGRNTSTKKIQDASDLKVAVDSNFDAIFIRFKDNGYIPVIFQVASLLAALAHPGHIVTYAPGDSLACRRDVS